MNSTVFSHLASVVGVSALLAISGCEPKTPQASNDREDVLEPPEAVAPSGDPRVRTVYVPAYSHLPQKAKPRRSMLSILLSVRNVDSSAVVTLNSVDYFDTSGHMVKRYLERPRKLRPLETAEFLVDTEDDAGGSGANFLVYWEGPPDAHPLLTESVMWGYLGQGYLSFTSRGVELDRRPDPDDFIVAEPDCPQAPPGGDASPGAR